MLTGKVIRRGDDLTVTAELVDVGDGSHLWGKQYVQKLSDLLAVQARLSRDISENLRLRLSVEDRRDDWFFAKKEKKDYLWALDRIAIVVALSGFLIRMGNLMNSEIYGIETTVPWGFVFLRNHEVAPKHPTQIYEGLAYLAIFILLYRLYWSKKGEHYQGMLISLICLLVFSARFFIEFLKEDQVAFEATMKLNMGQWLSIPFILLGISRAILEHKEEKAGCNNPEIGCIKTSGSK